MRERSARVPPKVWHLTEPARQVLGFGGSLAAAHGNGTLSVKIPERGGKWDWDQ